MKLDQNIYSDVDSYILKVVEGNASVPVFDTQKNVDSIDEVDYPRQRANPIILRSHLLNHDDWPTWKFSVKVKVTMFKKESSKNSGKTYKIEDSEIFRDMEINLLQATL